MENTLESIESFDCIAARIVDIDKLFTDKVYCEMYIAALKAENEVLRFRRIVRNGKMKVNLSYKKVSEIVTKRDCVRISMGSKID